jgi:hypothetical protein
MATKDAIIGVFQTSESGSDLVQLKNSNGPMIFNIDKQGAINWRNSANTADIPLTKDTNDNLTYNGNVIATTNGPISAMKPATSNAIQYVTTTGNDANDGLSWGTAKATIQAAVNALPLTPDGSTSGVVYVAPGTYTFSTGIVLPASHKHDAISIIGVPGEGTTGPASSVQGGVILNYTGSGAAITQLVTQRSNVTDTAGAIRDLVIDGTGSTGSAIGIHFGGMLNMEISNVGISNFAGAGQVGILVENVDSSSGPTFTERGHLRNVMFENDNIGVYFKSSTSVNSSFGHWSDNTIYFDLYTGQTGIVIGGGGGGSVYGGDWTFNGNFTNYTGPATFLSIDGVSNFIGYVNFLCESGGSSNTRFSIASGGRVITFGEFAPTGVFTDINGNPNNGGLVTNGDNNGQYIMFNELSSTAPNTATSHDINLANFAQIGWRNGANTGDVILFVNGGNNLVFNGNGFQASNIFSANPNISGSGFVRLGSVDSIVWRNNAGTADIPLAKNTSDALTYNGNVIATTSGVPWSSVTLSSTNTGTGMVLAPTATGTVPFQINAPSGMTTNIFGISTGGKGITVDPSDNLNIVTSTAATSTQAQASPLLVFQGQYWNGTASATDFWEVFSNIGSGTNGPSVLTFTHTGTSGTAIVSMPAILSGSPSPAGSGFERLASGDTISWRNNANTADIALAKNTSDALTYNGNVIATTSGVPWSSVTLSATNTGTGMVLAPTATGTVPFQINAPSGMTVDAFDVAVGSSTPLRVTSNGIVNINNTLLGSNSVFFNGNSLTNAAYLGSNVAPGPSSGFVRMASTDSIVWRNNGNTADIPLAKDTSDNLTYNGHVIATTSGPVGLQTFAVDLTAQAANFATQTFTTPSANGYYLVSAYEVITQAATTSSTTPTVKVNYTDADSGVATSVVLTGGNTSNAVGYSTSSMTIGVYAKSGVAITLSSAGYASSGATAMQYAVHARLQGPM